MSEVISYQSFEVTNTTALVPVAPAASGGGDAGTNASSTIASSLLVSKPEFFISGVLITVFAGETLTIMEHTATTPNTLFTVLIPATNIINPMILFPGLGLRIPPGYGLSAKMSGAVAKARIFFNWQTN